MFDYNFSKVLEAVTDANFTFPLKNIPLIKESDDIGRIIFDKMQALGGIQEQDIFVVASKIVSKSEGRIIDLSTIQPSEKAIELSKKYGKLPTICQVILNESSSYEEKGIIKAKHKQGFVLTSAGVDKIDNNHVSILPADPDKSAFEIMKTVSMLSNKKVGIVINDSEGRDDRRGAGSVCIGIAGVNPLRVSVYTNSSGEKKQIEETICDLLSCQGALIMGQRGNDIPVVCIRGFLYKHDQEANLKSIL